MKHILVTGGTVFVSRYAAEYFSGRGYHVSVLNRGTRPQPDGVTFIKGDRHDLRDLLHNKHFDVILDINAYTARDVDALLDAVDGFEDYVLISSSAVYPETLSQPFDEDNRVGENKIWGVYGTNKIAAEQALFGRVPHAYVLRPPYLYGPMQNLYREPFVFECALKQRPFYIPGDGSMKLQFFHVRDLCRLIEAVLEHKPQDRVLNTGNPDAVTIADWVSMCYRAAGSKAELIRVDATHPQRSYFPFYPYEYHLQTKRQQMLLPSLTPLETGLKESFAWYVSHPDEVIRKPFMDYIDQYIVEGGNTFG